MMRDTEEGPVYDFVDTEQAAFVIAAAEMGKDAVAIHVTKLAYGSIVVTRTGVQIGSRYTGRREFEWDSRTGTYSESLPLMDYDAWLIQRALVPDLLVAAARRIKEFRRKA